MERFERHWQKWDSAVSEGQKPKDFLADLSDETVVELLAAGDPITRRYELNLLASEMDSRLARLRRLTRQAARASHERLEDATRSAEQAAENAQVSRKSIEHHIETRGDQVDGEPQHARNAVEAAVHTRDALDELRDLDDRLRHLLNETRRHAREPDEEN